ncbi:MAG: S41 family peptidase [Byssovorax sp.]
MLPASNRGVGLNIGFPDVCLTPIAGVPVPIPYPNFAAHGMAAPFAATVLIAGMNGLNQGSMIPMTFGDEPGVAHPTIKGTGAFTMGNPVVSIEGLPAINLLCPTTGNNVNDGLGAVLVPDAVNVFYTYAVGEGAAPRAMDSDALAAHRAPLAAPDRLEARLLAGGLGAITVRAFSSDLPSQLFDRVRRLEEQGLRALVLDLRGNPGGELEACVALAADFLDDGSEIVVLTDADGDATTRRARGEPLYRLPLAVLIDGGTASAAELFAGCLQAHGRAVIVGETSHGKGTAQRLIPAPDERGSIYATVAWCALPGGVRLDGVGVRPDVEARGDDAPIAAMRALLAAISSS